MYNPVVKLMHLIYMVHAIMKCPYCTRKWKIGAK